MQPVHHNHQPTNQMSRQGLYVPKKAYFGAKMVVFGPKYFGREQKFWFTHIGKPLRPNCFLDGHGIDQIGQYLAQNDQNAYSGQNLVILGPKILMFTGGSKSFDTHIT